MEPTLFGIVLRAEDLDRPLDPTTPGIDRAATGPGWPSLLAAEPTWEDAEWR